MYVYIMGRGHSGSTILDIILGSSAAVESLGELVSGLGRCAAGEQCSCGSPMRECVFWCEVRRRFEAQGYGWDEFVVPLARCHQRPPAGPRPGSRPTAAPATDSLRR